MRFYQKYGGLSRCCAANGSSTGFYLVGPAKVKACNSYVIIQQCKDDLRKVSKLTPEL